MGHRAMAEEPIYSCAARPSPRRARQRGQQRDECQAGCDVHQQPLNNRPGDRPRGHRDQDRLVLRQHLDRLVAASPAATPIYAATTSIATPATTGRLAMCRPSPGRRGRCSSPAHRPNRPKSLPKKPARLAEPAAAVFSALLCPPGHHWPAGTPALTVAMCWPQPAQVVLPQVLHRTARHMGGTPFNEGGEGRGLVSCARSGCRAGRGSASVGPTRRPCR